MIAEAELKQGKIFGDLATAEFVYMPASEIGVGEPLCVYEHAGTRHDVDMKEALRLLQMRSLRPVQHPVLGEFSC